MRQSNRHSIDRNNQNEPENKLQINPETSEDNSKKGRDFRNRINFAKIKRHGNLRTLTPRQRSSKSMTIQNFKKLSIYNLVSDYTCLGYLKF